LRSRRIEHVRPTGLSRDRLADYLGNGPITCDELARSVGVDSRTLDRVLRLLSSVGVFTQVAPRSFGLAALGETLRSDAPGSVRNFAITVTGSDFMPLCPLPIPSNSLLHFAVSLMEHCILGRWLPDQHARGTID
jgi:hypothetical protein